MLIVATQDIGKYALYETITDMFLGVNLHRDDAIKIIMEHKGCSEQDAINRIDHPQPFSDIAKAIDVYDEEEAIHFLTLEIENCKARLLEYNPMYDGVNVGSKEARKLNENHIRFCKQIMCMLTNENYWNVIKDGDAP